MVRHEADPKPALPDSSASRTRGLPGELRVELDVERDKRRAGSRASLKIGGREVLDAPVCAFPARSERLVVEEATFVEREGKHTRGVGQAREVDGTDGVDGLDDDRGVRGTAEGGEVAGKMVLL